MKIYFTCRDSTREGLEAKYPSLATFAAIPDSSVEEIQGEMVLEVVPDLVEFINQCHRILVPGGKCTFSAPYYASAKAWAFPDIVRGLSEITLHFASKDWRTANKYNNPNITADFQVDGQFAVEEAVSHRADDVRGFWMQHYLNVVQAVLFTLTKK